MFQTKQGFICSLNKEEITKFCIKHYIWLGAIDFYEENGKKIYYIDSACIF